MRHTSINYEETGVPCTACGLPLCYLDGQICSNEKCRYFIPYLPLDNCILRNESGRRYTLDEIALIFGITRQRVEQIEKEALGKLTKNATPELRELLHDFARMGIK